MKKTVLSAIFGIAVAATAAVSFYVSHNGGNAEMDKLTLANIEALADGENGSSQQYANVREESIEIIDDATGVYKKVVVKICENPGSLDC